MKPSRAIRKVLPWVVVLGLAAGGWIIWSTRESRAPASAYRTETLTRGPLSETVTAIGTLSAVTTVQVGSQVSGIVARLHADFNSPVNRGQLLAELDPTPFLATLDQRRADVARAEVELRAAEISYHRQERLNEQGLTSEADYDAAMAAYEANAASVDQSRAALRQAETNLAYTRIVSPIDGVVVDRQYDVGQTVAASFQAPTLFTIAQDLTKMQVQADVDQADIGKIVVGQNALFTVDAYPEVDFAGVIAQIRLNATVNQNVITYPVIITVDNPEEKLRPQMTANVSIVVSTESDVLRVPNAALRFRPLATGDAGGSSGGGGANAATRDPDRAAAQLGSGGTGFRGAAEALSTGGSRERSKRQQTIYLLEGGGSLRAVPVRTGITDGRQTAILEGEVELGDTVVTGLVTSRVQSTGTFPGMQGPGGGRGGPR